MPYTKEQARAEIVNLVANFRANEPSLADVPEAQIEDNYIRKLFRYLNWNTGNTGLSVAEWEFVLQRTDEKGKRPDYILQLDGQQLLVMDAKKVKYDMHDPRWVTQVYAYAYSTQNQPTPRKIDFALLTDFQEFILLDCTLYAADPKAVSNFRILDWTCDDYVSQFDTLWELFERENVRAAARSRDTKEPSGLWSRYLSPKKVKANRIPAGARLLWRWAAHDAWLSGFARQRQGWKDIGNQVEPQNLQGQERQGPAHHDRHKHGEDLAQVAREKVMDELFHVGEDGSSFFHSRDDGGKVVIGQHHVGGFTRHVCAHLPHRHTDVGRLQSRGIVHAVARHRDNLTISLQSIHNPKFMFR